MFIILLQPTVYTCHTTVLSILWDQQYMACVVKDQGVQTIQVNEYKFPTKYNSKILQQCLYAMRTAAGKRIFLLLHFMCQEISGHFNSIACVKNMLE